MEPKNFIYIDGLPVPYEGERNILEVIRKAGIDLPTFCYHSDLSVYGACRLCVVDIEGRGVQASCTITPTPDMRIKTQTNELRTIRKINLELLLANHDVSCPTCTRADDCRLKDLSSRLGISTTRFKKAEKLMPIDESSPSLTRDPNKCVLCGDCVRMCREVQTVGAIDFAHRGSKSTVEPAFGKGLSDVECVYCGQCVAVCPTGALAPKSQIEKAWAALNDPEMVVVAQVAPAVRVSIGEMFGLPAGTISIGQIVASMKRLGFDQVYDTSFSADLTVIEEATEFIQRKLNGEKLPQFTSCCPAWVKFAEQYYPDLLPNLSSCRSPQQMFGSLAKEILPKLLNVKPEKLFMVSIMPCTAKKYEADRPEFETEGIKDVDCVLTTRELGQMIKEAGINFVKLSPESLDMPLGFKTGAGLIFGNAGGVSEAVLRFAYEKITGQKAANFEFKQVRGMDGLRKVELTIGEVSLSLVVANSLQYAREICDEVREGTSTYDLIEIMACPLGCINGGGQPINYNSDYKANRTKGLFDGDRMLQLRHAQDNPYIKEVYEKYLGEPGGHTAHRLLHTHYHNQKRLLTHDMDLEPQAEAKVNVRVCVGTNCFIKGSQELLRDLMNFIEEKKYNERVNLESVLHESVDVKATFCFENCGKAINVSVGDVMVENANFENVKAELERQLAMTGSLA